MKQINLFDAFNRKGLVKKNEQKKEQKQVENPQQKPDIKPSAQKQEIKKSKKTKLTIDSDDQKGFQKVQNIDMNQYRIAKQQNNVQSKGKIKKSIGFDQNSQQSFIQQEFDNPKEKKKITSSQKQHQQIKQNAKDGQTQISQFTESTPRWAQKQYCLDAFKRPSNHPEYDPTTLYIPQSEWSKLSAPMKQFWKIKSQNFDKIVLFKLGKFYELFYDDAVVGNKYLDLKFMGTKMHSGFPEKSLDRYANELVQLGFKTIIVEQMQTPEQMNERIKKNKQKGIKSDKTLQRQITQILTRGTMPPSEENEQVYLPNYLLSIRIHQQQYAFALLEIGTNQIALGLVQGLEDFKTVLYQTRPVEVVYDPDNLPFEVSLMMEKSFLQIQMSKVVNKKNVWHPLNAQNEIENLQKEEKIRKPKILKMLEDMEDSNKNILFSTLSGMFDYLKKVFRFDYVIGTARFQFYQKKEEQKPMVLDSQALQHLQVFETVQGEQGSLFKAIDRTKTKFGKRLLRRWLMSPLTNINHLNDRLDAIQDLQENILERQKISRVLKKLPDLEKIVNKLYHYAVKNTSASKAIYFEDIHVNRLKQFKSFIQNMETAWQGIGNLSKVSHSFKSSRLRSLTKIDQSLSKGQNKYFYQDEECDVENRSGLLPNVMEYLEQFNSYIKWQDNVPIPQKGLVADFDQLQNQIEEIKAKFSQYLQKLRYQLKQPNIKFTHTKERYEIEIPQKSQKRRPSDFQFTSKKSGFSRYITPITKKLVKQLQKTEQLLKKQLGHFVSFFFQQFKKKHQVWHRFISILSQLDCLISLSQYSFQNSKVRPQFSTQSKFEIRDAVHPALVHINFIPNDIVFNKKVILLTGPNMGGKSTILRTSCTLAVLAQIGCYVTASYYSCSPVDRIFTRIGASDKLEVGKSTFFIQMQQTKNILMQGTERSLAIIDELGRGTSTFDGLAIAYSVLRDITSRIDCYCLFATHYHILLQQFKNSSKVELMKMGCLIKEGDKNRMVQQSEEIIEKQITQIVFLYKLQTGNVDKSFGLNIAQKVGIQAKTLKLAASKAQDMNRFIEKKQRGGFQVAIKFLQQVQQ